MSIVTINDFIGEIKVPLSSPTCGESQKLTSIIVQYEQDILVDLLGEMYGDFIVNQADTKYQTLINGGDFVANGVSIPFIGLRSLMAYKMYYYYQHSESTQSTSIGEQKPNNVDNYPVLVGSKLAMAWNRFVRLTGKPSDSQYKPTLYNFLNKGDYTNWCITYIEPTNSLGL